MTAPTTVAPTASTEGGGGAEPGQAPGSSTSPAGPGDTTTTAADRQPAGDGDGPRGRRGPGERVRTASRDDDAPQDTGGEGGQDGDGDGDGKPAKPGDWRVEDLPAGAQKLIAELRKENGTRRTEAADAKKTAAQALAKAKEGDDRFANATEAFMKALGLTPEDDEPERSPEELVGELTDKYRQTRVELSVYRAAAGHGADPDALLDSRGFLTKAHALDPAADGFDQAIADAIGEAVAANPKLRAETPETDSGYSAPSGGDFGGGPAEPLGPEEWSVDDFRRNRQNNSGRG